MDNISTRKKRKGGQAREKEKNKKLLSLIGQKCEKINSYFKGADHKNTSILQNVEHEQEIDFISSTFSSNSNTSLDLDVNVQNKGLNNDIEPSSTLCVINKNNNDIGIGIQFEEQGFKNFKKPIPPYINHFFSVHPIQPSDNATILPFDSKKVFFKNNNMNRIWCTYDVQENKLYCSVCLAFTTEMNTFTTGLNDCRHVHQRIKEHENSKNHNFCSEAYFLHFQKKDIGNLLRQVLDRIINVIKLIGKCGLSIRGKRNEVAYLLNKESVGHGNFLELIILLSKYDVVLNEHLNSVIKKSEKQHNCNSKGRGNLVTFLSHYTTDNIINIISNLIKSTISKKIKEANMFSTLLDTTQDISVMDQCSIFIRYVVDGMIHERLISVKSCVDSTGKGMMNLLKKAVDTESYQRMNLWKELSEKDNIHKRLQAICETRWTAKETAIKRLFGTYNSLDDNGMLSDLLLVLTKIVQNPNLNPDVRSKASNFISCFIKYETILVAHMYMKIFQITGPLSRYLQSNKLDLLKCQQMVTSALENLKGIQRGVENVKEVCNTFITNTNNKIETMAISYKLNVEQIQSTFKEKRIAKKKKTFNHENEEDLITTPEKKFTIEVFNTVLDTVVNSMNTRFVKNNSLYFDLSLLCPKNFPFNNLKDIPESAFLTLATKLKPFIPFNDNKENNVPDIRNRLSEELWNFSNSLEEEYDKITLNETIGEDQENYENLSTPCNLTCKSCSICCYRLLVKYNLFSNAYSLLTLAYKYLLTLPVTQISCERSFSTLKYLKNRLRNSMANEKLESFMLMSIEKSILMELNNDTIINELGTKSDLLSKLLL
ncbi:hypothetical protein QTP88_016768 [Uroleucon formosanum]